MKNTLLFLSLLFVFTSCFTYKEVQFNGVSDFHVDDINKEKATVSFKASIYNPNNYNIKVKSNDLDVLLSDKKVGTAKIKKKVVIKKQTSGDYDVQVDIDLKKFAGGGLFGLAKVLSGKSLSLRVRGFLKVRARGLGKKIEIDEQRSFNPSDLNIDLPF